MSTTKNRTGRRVLVCGGRYYDNAATIHSILTELGPISLLIEGGAHGADTMAGKWADLNGVPHLRVPAQWDKFGRAAGAMRNAEMLTWQPDLVLAFPGGRGTENMKSQARHKGVFVKVVKDEQDSK